MAESGRGDDQVAAGRGKKPARIRPIGARWASSDRCWSTAAASPSAWRSPAPTRMTKSSLPRRSAAFPSSVRDRCVGKSSIFAPTKVTTPRLSERPLDDGAIRFTSPPKANPPRRAIAADPRPAAGLSSRRNTGQIDHDLLRKESRQLSRYGPSPVRHHRATRCQGSRIGSKP